VFSSIYAETPYAGKMPPANEVGHRNVDAAWSDKHAAFSLIHEIGPLLTALPMPCYHPALLPGFVQLLLVIRESTGMGPRQLKLEDNRGLRAIRELRQLTEALEQSWRQIDEVASWTAELILHGSKLLVCGNGGSAAESQHFAAELVGRYDTERSPLPAVALVADGVLLTCLLNDYPSENIFGRQVVGLGKPGDLLVALSTSGESANVLAAITAAKSNGLHTLALLGKGGGKAAGMAEREWIVPCQSTARIQEAHLLFIHIVCEHIDAAMGRGEG
jgi:D-sedoheptulose 7-phosphate isomerase